MNGYVNSKRWIVKLFSIIVVVSVFLVGCSSEPSKPEPTQSGKGNNGGGAVEATTAPANTPEQEKVTIEFWHAFGEGEEEVFLQEVLPAFNEAHPHITVNSTRMPTENLEQQVITAVVGKVAPDVMRMDNTWIAKFAREGALQPVDGFPAFADIKASTFDAPMSTNYYDGQYYGVPLDTNTKIAIYNKELLAEAGATDAPQTMDELVELARVLKNNNKYGITIGGVDAWNMLPWFWTMGGKLTDDEFKQASSYINSDESVKALETIIAWNDEGLLAPPILAGQPGTWEGLRGEEGMEASYMMINDGPWFFGILGDAVVDTMIPAKMPNGPDGKSHSVIGGQNLVMFKDAKQPEAAWTFSQFMLSEDIQLLMALKTGAIPTNKTAAQSTELDSVYYLKHFVAELDTALARTPSPHWDKIEAAFQSAFELAVRKEAPVKEVLDKAAAEIDGFLQQK